MNFGGFYFAGPIEALRKEGFRVVVPDQIGFGRSSKPVIPYNFHDMASNSRRLLQSLGIARAAIVGHSMGGMLAARFAASYPDMTELAVLYDPIGLTDPASTAPGARLTKPTKQRWPRRTTSAIRRSMPNPPLLSRARRMEARVRKVRAHPICSHAKRRLAAPRDGPRHLSADHLSRPGGL